VTEWRAWKNATSDDRSCWSCHARGDHALSGHRPIASLRGALQVRREGSALVISTRGAGHPLPTGDVMRWLSLEFSSDGFEWQSAARFGLRLGTRVWPQEPEPRLGIVEDTRLAPGEARRIEVPPGAAAWQVVYHLVSEGQEQRRNLSPDLSRVVLQSG